jgi:GAF domain
MFFSNWFAIATNILTAIVCSAIVLLLLSQLRNDAKSRSLARLMVPLALIGLFNIIIRFMAFLGENVDVIFMILTVLTACLPYFLLTFIADYFDTWSRWTRWMTRALALLIVIVAVLYLAQIALHFPILIKGTHVSPEGLMLYEYGPFSDLYVVLIAFAELGVFLSVWITIQQYRQKRDRANRNLMIGIILLVIGLLLVPVPGIEHYAFEQIFYAAGSIVLVSPVLNQRLFDPLSQLNVKLKNRAEQLALITRVGQQATSVLASDTLLQKVAQDIQQSFGYDGITILLLNQEGQAVVGALVVEEFDTHFVSDIAPDVAFIPRQFFYTSDVLKDNRFNPYLLRPETRSVVSIPLMVGSSGRPDEALIGVLYIQDKKVNAFTDEDLAGLYTSG